MMETLLLKQFELLSQVIELKPELKTKKKISSNEGKQKNKTNLFQINSFNFEISSIPIKKAKTNTVKTLTILKNNYICFFDEEEKLMISKWISNQQYKWKLLYNPIYGEDNYNEYLKLCYNKPAIVLLS